jgi:hypothetical protein
MVTLTEKPDKAIGVVRVRHTLNYGEVKIDLSSRPPLPGQDVLCRVVLCCVLSCAVLFSSVRVCGVELDLFFDDWVTVTVTEAA